MSTIVFPQPPPTSNKLSHAERAKLLRTTAKLGHVLGSTPHIIDYSLRECPIVFRELFFFFFYQRPHVLAPVQVQLPSSPTKNKFGFRSTKPRSSIESNSDSSDDEPDSPQSRVNSPDSTSYSSHASARSRRTSFSTHSRRSSIDSEGAWRSVLPELPTRRPPILKLALSSPVASKYGRRPGMKPDLETIPGSPPCTKTTYKQAESFSCLADSDTSPSVPTFNIPTDARIRRDKMRRLTKKLGEGVPMHLVFPPSAQSDDEDVIVDIPSTPSSVCTMSFSSTNSACSLSPLVPSSPSSISSSSSSSSTSSFTSTSYHSLASSPTTRRSSSLSLSRPFYRHEPEFQLPRKSNFAEKPLPDAPQTVKTFSGKFIVHYENTGGRVGGVGEDHGRKRLESFEGLKCVGARSHERSSSRSSTSSGNRLEVVQE